MGISPFFPSSTRMHLLSKSTYLKGRQCPKALWLYKHRRDLLPLYTFEPGAEKVLDALLPKYVNARLFNCMLQAAASELAARQRAMKSATDNAEELIKKYTRLANQARQAEITQEISEIVGGASALAESK